MGANSQSIKNGGMADGNIQDGTEMEAHYTQGD